MLRFDIVLSTIPRPTISRCRGLIRITVGANLAESPGSGLPCHVTPSQGYWGKLCRLIVSWTDMFMRLTVSKTLLVILLLLGCSSVPAGPPPKALQATDRDRGSTIEWLRTEFVHLRRLPAEESYEPEDWRTRDISSLVGMTRNGLLDALGPPDLCPRSDGGPCGLVSGRVLVYVLFHLPPLSIGGGPHLVIRLDETDVCTRAYLLGTK